MINNLGAASHSKSHEIRKISGLTHPQSAALRINSCEQDSSEEKKSKASNLQTVSRAK